MLRLVSKRSSGDSEGWSVDAVVKGISSRLRHFLNSDQDDYMEKLQVEDELDELARIVDYSGYRYSGAGQPFTNSISISNIKSKGNQVKIYFSGGLDI